MGKWTKRGVLPPADVLLEIARHTQCDLHWLLTGEGEADLDPFRFLDQEQRQVLEMFTERDKPFEAVVREFVREGLAKTAVEMIANQKHLTGRQVDQLIAIVSLRGFDPAENRETDRQGSKRRQTA